MLRRCARRRRTSRRRLSCSGSSSFAWPLSISTSERFCTATLNLKMSSWQETTHWSWAISASQRYWLASIISHCRCRVHRITCRPKSANPNRTTTLRTSGHLAASSTNFARCSMLSPGRICLASSLKSYKTSKARCQTCTHKTWRTSSPDSWWKMRRKGHR